MLPRVGVLRHTLFLPSERFIPDQARAVEGWRPILLARDEIVGDSAGLEVRRLPGMTSAGRGAYTLLGWDRPLVRAIDRLRLEVLHAHFGVEGAYSRRAAERSGVAHVVTLHGFDVSYTDAHLRASRKPGWVRYAAARRRLLESGSVFVCVSRHVQARAMSLGLDPARSVVLSTGVDTARLAPTEPPGAMRIAHVARLVEKKGTGDLLEALALLRRGGVDAELDVVGDGPLRGELEDRAGALGVDSVVRFHGVGSHEAALRAIGGARVVCQPSVTASTGDMEGLPQSVLEAGALGRAVVATDHAGIAEAVRTGETGFLVPERDPRALAEALRRALTDVGAAERMGSAGAALVRREFDLHRQARRLSDVYRRARDGVPMSDI